MMTWRVKYSGRTAIVVLIDVINHVVPGSLRGPRARPAGVPGDRPAGARLFPTRFRHKVSRDLGENWRQQRGVCLALTGLCACAYSFPLVGTALSFYTLLIINLASTCAHLWFVCDLHRALVTQTLHITLTKAAISLYSFIEYDQFRPTKPTGVSVNCHSRYRLRFKYDTPTWLGPNAFSRQAVRTFQCNAPH